MKKLKVGDPISVYGYDHFNGGTLTECYVKEIYSQGGIGVVKKSKMSGKIDVELKKGKWTFRTWIEHFDLRQVYTKYLKRKKLTIHCSTYKRGVIHLIYTHWLTIKGQTPSEDKHYGYSYLDERDKDVRTLLSIHKSCKVTGVWNVGEIKDEEVTKGKNPYDK